MNITSGDSIVRVENARVLCRVEVGCCVRQKLGLFLLRSNPNSYFWYHSLTFYGCKYQCFELSVLRFCRCLIELNSFRLLIR